MTTWHELFTFGLRHWSEKVLTADWDGDGRHVITETHPDHHEVLAALPADIRARYDAADAITHERRGDSDGWEAEYGHWAGTDPREWCPDLECNTEQEIRHWAAACALYDQGDALRHEATYPNHPLGCSRDERFGFGSWWRKKSAEELEFERRMVDERLCVFCMQPCGDDALDGVYGMDGLAHASCAA